MPPEGLTRAQESLLTRVVSEEVVPVRGADLRTAESLQARGLIEVRIKGWKHEAVALTRSADLR